MLAFTLMRCAAVLCLFLVPQLTVACTCLVSRSVCQEVAGSDFVFIGTVEAIEPSLLNPWQPSTQHDALQDPEIIELKKDKSESGVKKLRERYLQLLFDLPKVEKVRLASASTQEDLQTVMTWILSQGTRVRFRVRTTFQKKEDPDSDPKEDREEAAPSQFAEIWNEPGDCGIPFQKGETYLVYATDDEELDHLETNRCHRTERLSEAGEDLAYLYFFQNGNVASGRLEGFVTSEISQLNPDRFHYSEKIKSPVSDVIVELKYDGGVRYSAPDRDGRFVFDGLTKSEYQVSILEQGFPDRYEVLSGPKQIQIQAKGCVVTTFLVMIHHTMRK